MHSSDSLVIPGFVSNPEWKNQWNIGKNQVVDVSEDAHGRLRIEKREKFTLHTVLNADAGDLDVLRRGYGVPVGTHQAFVVALGTQNEGVVKTQLVIHEFDVDLGKLNRRVVDNGDRVFYIPGTKAQFLVVSIRATGSGVFTMQKVEFVPTTRGGQNVPGLHSLHRSSTSGRSRGNQSSGDLALLMSIRRALYDRVPLGALMSRSEAVDIVDVLLPQNQMLDVKEIVSQLDIYSEFNNIQLRKMFWHGRRVGYLAHAIASLDEVISRTGQQKDREAAEKLRAEHELYRNPWSLLSDLPVMACHDPQGPVLHMVGKALPQRQTGYTVRTRYTVEALRNSGVDSVIAVQAGGNHENGLPSTVEETVNGIPTILFGGPSKKDVPADIWMERNAEELLKLVRSIRPSVIHSHSDFINGVLATHVGEAASVPVVYESRGFWEETWISRVGQVQKWDDIDLVIKMYGAPELYELRRESERSVRERADRVVTLAQTMKDFILQESPDGRIAPEHVVLAHNAVSPDDFPVSNEISPARRMLGLEDDTVVIGYISSILEYEGIEYLLDGFKLLSSNFSCVSLIIVGDGPHLSTLRKHAEHEGIPNVIFTGRIPHNEILNYYYTIDIFVVPRRNTRVTELVTPLKPFEAFATGRAVVMSDVAALAEIARDAGGAAQTFRADDKESLAEVLERLVKYPELRRRMAVDGADWVRAQRSWNANVPIYRHVYAELQDQEDVRPDGPSP